MILSGWHQYYLDYLFAPRTLVYRNNPRLIVEAGPQTLVLSGVNIRPITPTKCMFILEMEKPSEYKYVPIVKNYTIEIKNGPDMEAKKMDNFLFMAFGMRLDYGKQNIIEIFEIISKKKKTSFNAIIGFNKELVLKEGMPIIDYSLEVTRLFNLSYRCLFSSFMVAVRMADKPFKSIDYDVMSLIMPFSDKDQQLINNYNLCKK